MKMKLSMILTVVFGLLQSVASTSEYSACPSISPGPVTAFQLPELLHISLSTDPIATESIRNTLALYAFALDGRNAAFSRIFAPNVRANYSKPLGIMYGVKDLTDRISVGVSQFAATQHRYGTQYIAICSPSGAISVTYIQASHFFLPDIGPIVEDDSHTLFATGRYEDTWAKLSDGTWKIVNRNFVFMGPLIGSMRFQ